MSRSGGCFGIVAGSWLFAAAPAYADLYVNGGGDPVIMPALSAELQVVYAGQHFTAATVDSMDATGGFLSNDCTFGILPNCSWSPLGAGTAVDFSVSLIPLTEAQVKTYSAGLGGTDGPLVQFPLYALPIAIVGQENGITANGQLVLDDGALCGIFSGQLTDWSQFSNSVPAGGFSVVYDANDGSGATWLLTQHLNAVCNSTNSVFTSLPVPVTGNFASLPVPGGVANNPRFAAAAGGTGMQSALLNRLSALGYIGPSFTSIAPSSPATSNLNVAALVNGQNHVPYTPSTTATALALRSPGPGSVNVNPPSTMQQAADPTNWVPQVPQPAAGYPIVGYANWILSTCYASVGRVVLQYLATPYDPTEHTAIIGQNGFVKLNSVNGRLAQAVGNVLLRDGSGYGLNIENALACLAYRGR